MLKKCLYLGWTILLASIIMLDYACKKDTCHYPDNHGKTSFWVSPIVGLGFVVIEVDGIYHGTLLSTNPNEPPCGESGQASNFIESGRHTYVAKADNGLQWTGNFDVTNCECNLVYLDPAYAVQTAQGDAYFYTTTDLGCGFIKVNIAGQSEDIIYPNDPNPSCGSILGARFSLDPGTYNYYANCTGKNWTGIVTIAANECSKIQLK